MKSTTRTDALRKRNPSMTAYRFNIEDFTAARSDGLGSDPPTLDSLSDRDPESTNTLLSLFKAITGQKSKRDLDGKSVTRRLWLVLEEVPLAEAKETLTPKKDKESQPELPMELPKMPVKKEPRKEGAGTPGRKPGSGQFMGKRIYPLRKTNPRRIGTLGWKAYEIVKGRTEGVPYEDYLAAGGRPPDLRWDLARKWVEVK